jgi:uncharacterized cysteine cluster protein YcgN (CxxCxxCC family)
MRLRSTRNDVLSKALKAGHTRKRKYSMSDTPFWECKTLDEMTDTEWESLCDGCGQCCLHKLVNEETADVFYTRVACSLFNTQNARCRNYPKRFTKVKDCLDVRSMTSSELGWMPKTCAYRRIHEHQPLPLWHPLLTGDAESTRSAGMTVTGWAVNEETVDMDKLEAEIIEWIDA